MDILTTLLEITVYSAVIFVITMLMKTTLKNKMSPWLHYAVWFVLILRLMLPVTIESTFHLISVTGQPQAQTAEDVQPQAESAALPQADSGGSSFTPSQIPGINAPVGEPLSAASSVPAAQPIVLTLPDILLTAWLSGTGICLLYLIVLYGRLRRKIAKNAAAPSDRLLTLFEQVKAELGIRSKLRLVCPYEYGTPALMFPRTVLMPIDALVAMDDEQAKFALRHELMHYKRRDHIVCLGLSLLNAVYWFNPVVWLALRQIRLDIETACDGAVVKTLDIAQKSRYASLIVSLFAQPVHRQLVLGMAQENARKVAERRVRGIFMRGRSGHSATLLSALLAVILAVTCFTTACQPTPETPPVVNKDTDLVEEVVQANNEENKAELEEDKQVIAEQIKKVNGHMQMDIKPNDQVTIKVDADIIAPEFDQIPIVRVKPKNLSQEQFDSIVTYLSGGQPLYYMERGADLSQEEIAVILPKLKACQSNEDLTSYMKDGLDYWISEVEEQKKTAKNQANEKPYDGTLIKTEENTMFSTITELKCYSISDRAAHINFYQSFSGVGSQFLFDDNDYGCYYTDFEPYEGIDAERIDMTYEEAKAKAEEIIHQIDGEDSDMTVYASSIAYQLNSFQNYSKETSPQAYCFDFGRCYNGIVLKNVGYLNGTVENVDYSQRVSPETIQIFIDNKGIRWVGWTNHTEYIHDVSDDTPLLDFDSVSDIFEQHCRQKFAWVPKDDALPPNQNVTLNVKQVELNLMIIPEKDKPDSYITVPVWDFIADMEYDEEVVAEDGYPAQGQQNVSIVTINAIDGSIINREQGF